MSKSIQMKQRENNAWIKLYPKTMAENVDLNNGQNLEIDLSSVKQTLSNKANKSEVYTATEVDTIINGLEKGVQVSATEPTNANVWFEIL